MPDALLTTPHTPATAMPLFKLGENCAHIARADFAAPVVDCAAFYGALHESICRAQHTIFILGWDIDSRIELLRGEDAKKSKCPTRFFELIQWKARQNPNLQIFLNRWSFALYLAVEREAFSGLKWKLFSPPNINFRMDRKVPFGACHHQKIIVIDDEVAYSGGMDIAQWRWDKRSHHPVNPRRIDPTGTYLFGYRRFQPYHDVQFILAGPAVRNLAEHVRTRWSRADPRRTPNIRPIQEHVLPTAWPPSIEPVFKDARIATAFTQPTYKNIKEQHHIKQLYLDMVSKAETFIYMENQYFTDLDIARALNARLKEKPELKLLMISSATPQGSIERSIMWYPRVHFRDIVVDGVQDRVCFAYPLSRENGIQRTIRVHSKLMIVDDKWLRVGSANLNNRSMGVDTECDLVVEAETPEQRAAVAAERNDLIREHTGLELNDIERITTSGPVSEFTFEVETSHQHLRPINDERYRNDPLGPLASHWGDPPRPWF